MNRGTNSTCFVVLENVDYKKCTVIGHQSICLTRSYETLHKWLIWCVTDDGQMWYEGGPLWWCWTVNLVNAFAPHSHCS